MDGGKISVIVPCYNIEAYIEKTVQSILEQTYKNLEVLLIDDGSTDATPDIIDRLARWNPCIRSFHKENGGVSSARLYGVERATGDWIAFADGDDLLRPEMYSVLMSNAVRYKAEISHCGYEMVFPDHIDKYYGTGKLVLSDNEEGLRELLAGSFIEPGLWNKLYRRRLVSEARRDCEASRNIRNMEDLLWNYYFFKRAEKSVFEDNCYYRYVLRKGSAATSEINRHKLIDPIKVFRTIERDVSDSADLLRVVRTRKAAALLKIAEMDDAGTPKWVKVCVANARRVLKQGRGHYLRGGYSRGLKAQILLITLSPKAYAFVHRIYARARGTDQKYDV